MKKNKSTIHKFSKITSPQVPINQPSQSLPIAQKESLLAQAADSMNMDNPGILEKTFQFKKPDQFLKSDFVDDMKMMLNSYVGSASCSIENIVDATAATTNLTEEILSKTTLSMSKSIEQNFSLGQKLLQCKDIKDIIAFQYGLFENNFSNFIDFYLNVNSLLQNFFAQNVKLSANHMEQNVKCFIEK